MGAGKSERMVAARPARRLWRLAAMTAVYVGACEWFLFGLGAFWSLEPAVSDMPARWHESMRVGAYLSGVRRSPSATPRLIAIGSSVLAEGFDAHAFTAAWARHSDLPPLQVHAAPLSGCTLYEALMLSQAMADPPPAYVLLGMSRRDVMPVMPTSLMLSQQAFHVPNVLPSGTRFRNAAPESAVQRLWRRAWPTYQHRILLQQLALHYRPSFRGEERAETDAALRDGPSIPTTGADIPLLAPWAAWCRARGIQPVLVMMPTNSTGRAGARKADGELGYVERCAAVARPSGVWFFDFTTAVPDNEFRDPIHTTAAGARRLAPLLAEAMAAEERAARAAADRGGTRR